MRHRWLSTPLMILFVLVAGVVLAACDDDEETGGATATPGFETLPWRRPSVPITAENAAQLQLTGVLGGQGLGVYQSRYSENGARLLTVSESEQIVWNIASGEPILRLDNTQTNFGFFSPDASTLYTLGADNQLRKWSLSDGQQVAAVSAHDQPYTTAALSPDGTRLVVGGNDGIVFVYDTENLSRLTTFVAHGGGYSVSYMQFNPEGNLLYTMGSNGSITSWDTTNWEEVLMLEQGFPPPQAIVGSPDDSLLAVVHPERVNIYDTRTGNRRLSFQIPVIETVEDVELTVDNRLIAIGGDIDSVLIHDVAGGELVVALRGHGTNFADMAFSPDGSLLLTGLRGANAFLWNLSGIVEVNAITEVEQVQVPRAVLGQVARLQLQGFAWSPLGTNIMLFDQSGPSYTLSVPE